MANKTYSEGERQAHHAKIVLTTFAVIAIATLYSLITDVAASRFLGFVALVVCFAAAYWWVFASRSAKPLQVDDGDYLPPVYGTIKRMIQAYKQR